MENINSDIYCPLTQMFHSSKVNVKVNHIHKRAQRIVYTTQKNNRQFSADFVTFTEEILNGKLNLSAILQWQYFVIRRIAQGR